MSPSGITQQSINMHVVTRFLLHTHVRTHTQAGTLLHAAIDLMKIRWMRSERWVAVLLIAVCPLLLIMMGCILENLQGIDFIRRDYLLSFSLEGWCVWNSEGLNNDPCEISPHVNSSCVSFSSSTFLTTPPVFCAFIHVNSPICDGYFQFHFHFSVGRILLSDVLIGVVNSLYRCVIFHQCRYWYSNP